MIKKKLNSDNSNMRDLTLIIPTKKEGESLPVFLKEIENYNLDILKKPRIIVLTKSDTLAHDDKKDLPDYERISSISRDGLQSLVNSLTVYLDE